MADATINDAARRGGPGAPPGCDVRLAIGGEIDGFESYDAAVGAEDGGALDDPVARELDAVHLGHVGAAQGRAPPGRATEPALAAVNLFGYDAGRGDVHLCTGPLYHAAPLAFSLAIPLAYGVGVVLMDGVGRRRGAAS